MKLCSIRFEEVFPSLTPIFSWNETHWDYIRITFKGNLLHIIYSVCDWRRSSVNFTKNLYAAFLYLPFWFVLFWCKNWSYIVGKIDILGQFYQPNDVHSKVSVDILWHHLVSTTKLCQTLSVHTTRICGSTFMVEDWWNWPHGSISPTFYVHLLRR